MICEPRKENYTHWNLMKSTINFLVYAFHDYKRNLIKELMAKLALLFFLIFGIVFILIGVALLINSLTTAGPWVGFGSIGIILIIIGLLLKS